MRDSTTVQKTNRTLRRQSGVTLLELLIVIVMVGLLATLAGPSFNATIARSKVSGLRDNMISATQFARSEALKRKAPVTVCSSDNQTGCGGSWEDGWIIFSDADGDSALDGGELVLQVHYGEGDVTTYQSAAAAITFDRLGRATAGAGQYAMCHPDQETVGRALTVTVTGAVEREKQTISSC